MAVKSFKPYSAGRRFMTVSSFEEITAKKPEKSLVESLKKNGGRNFQGRLTKTSRRRTQTFISCNRFQT